mmetsp:Transcript_64177/g.150641  ORF Transcript_64177/g.150641 Transcript_64177/m.150641 type:complete len:550 (+) Transcript_64177:50-1699(+)
MGFPAWLHPWHVAERAIPQPLALDADDEGRHAALQNLLRRSAVVADAAEVGAPGHGQTPEALEGADRNGSLRVADSALVWQSSDGSQTASIPLLLADLLYQAVDGAAHGSAPSHVIALAPRLAAAAGQVWLICVDFSPTGLYRFLGDLGLGGAIRWDLQDCYENSQVCCGQGIHGKVFVGRTRHEAGRPGEAESVALKVMAEDNNDESVNREVALLLRSRNHPNIASLLGVFCSPKQGSATSLCYVLVMELGAVGDVTTLLERGAVTSERAVQIMIGLSSALTHLHALRIIHRDVKLENVVLCSDMRALLIDFSIAVLHDDVDRMQRSAGTPGYAAPELLRGERYDYAVDIFAAGVFLFALLCAEMPFWSESQDLTIANTLHRKVRLPSEVGRATCKGLRRLLGQMLSKDAQKRPSARQCLDFFWQEATQDTQHVHAPSLAAVLDMGLRPVSEEKRCMAISTASHKLSRALTGDDLAGKHLISGWMCRFWPLSWTEGLAQEIATALATVTTHTANYVLKGFFLQRSHVFQLHHDLCLGLSIGMKMPGRL